MRETDFWATMQAALGGSKASAKPTDPKPFLVTLRLVLSMSEVEVFSVTTQNIAEDTPHWVGFNLLGPYGQACSSGMRRPGTRLWMNALARPHLTMRVTSAAALVKGLLVFAPRGKVLSQKLFLCHIFCESFAISALILRSFAGLKDFCETARGLPPWCLITFVATWSSARSWRPEPQV